MTQTAERPARYEDLLVLPEYLVGEILNGVFYTQLYPAAALRGGDPVHGKPRR
ncbi:hypothetical protein GWK36_00285 [Caldichromatium japonicum]|uniref:Uncharacterized protein n=1 Tax=Caldichromatium japonicum TaxID=2699430 RepID=A0A6G7V9Z3_9GAMM|nr:hypothetical protein [Caldichromatium japonicum]QIK36695.1 hypothetical protein GWK36_00285 [Caldichromatium japonicum]